MTIRSLPLWRIKQEINVGLGLVWSIGVGCWHSFWVGLTFVGSAVIWQQPSYSWLTWFYVGFALSMTACAGVWFHNRLKGPN